MKVSEFFEHLEFSDLSGMSVIKKYLDPDPAVAVKAERQLLSYTNLGVMALHRKFKLDTKVVVKDVYPETPLVEIKDTTLGVLLDVSCPNGGIVTFPTVTGVDYDINEVSKQKFLVANKQIEQLVFVYTCAPATLEFRDDTIAIPDLMVEALMHFVCTRAYSPISSSISQIPVMQNDFYLKRFERACDELTNQGFDVISDIRAKNVHDRGFV